jgi:hypothetical protein
VPIWSMPSVRFEARFIKEGDLVVGRRDRGRSINQSRPFLPKILDELPARRKF